jgi:predicted glutamine amidotransferase
MCLLIYKTAGSIIPEDHLKEAFDNNSHGAGFTVRMVNEAGEGYLHRERGFFRYNDFIEAYRPFASNQGIIHFRLATAGKKDEANCHPFEVTPDLHMGHNGIISIAQSVSKDYSDTWHYTELVVKPVYALNPSGFWDCGGLHFLLEESIGHSKLAFLHADGRFLIINESAGHWDDTVNPQIWYSNDSYEVPRYRYSTKQVTGFSCGWDYRSTASTTPAISSGISTSWMDDDDTETTTKKDMKRLARAKAKLAPTGNDWLVDDAFDAGMSAAEILAHSTEGEQGAEVLYDFIYGREVISGYRTWGNSIMSDL